jgi:hypothetical protein
LYVAGGSVSLVNDIFSANHAFGGAGGIGNNSNGPGGNGGEGAGGGIYAAGGSVSLSNDTLSSNHAVGGSGGMGGHGSHAGIGGNSGAGMGGGLYVAAASSVTLVNSTLSHNYAAGSTAGYGANAAGSAGGPGGAGGSGGAGMGGGLYVSTAGSLTLNNNTFSNNYALGGNGGNGGAGAWGGSAPLQAYNGGPGGAGGAGGISLGGGLYVAEGSITLVNNTFYSDSAFGGKGGNGGQGGTGGHTSSRSYIGGAGGAGGGGGTGMGGGLYAAEGSITLLNDTLSGINAVLGGGGGNGGDGGAGGHANNSAFPAPGGNGGNGGAGGNGQGGGFDVPATNVTYVLANTLIANNVPLAGNGGIGGAGGSGDSSGAGGVNGSAGTASGPNVSGSVTSSDHDLISDGSGSSLTNGVNGDQVGTDASPINPLLGALQNNSGPTQTMALLPNSPAINAGDSHAPGLPATDQRGFPRIVGSAVDIGAFEFGAEPGVSRDGTQLVIIGDPIGTGSNNSATVEVNASGGVSAILNGTTTSFNPGQITSILIALGGGSNTITVLSTPTGVTTDILGGGNDTLNVGNGTTGNIRGDVNIENAAVRTNIIVDDATDTSTHTVTFKNIGANPADSQGNSDPWGQVSGLLGNGNINYEIPDTAGVTVHGSNGASTYNILSTSVGLTVDAGNSSDTFNVGSGNSLHSIQSPVTLNGGDGTNTLNANDSSGASGQRYTLSNTQLGGTDFAPITYALMSAINVTASGSDTLTILQAPAAFVTFHGGSGTNTLVGPTATSLTTWSISGVNAGTVGNVSFSNFQNLAGGAASDAFDFTTSTASLSGTINGGGGTNNNNTLSYATLGSSYLVSVKLTSNTAGSATHVGGGFSNINYVIGSTDTGNTLQGPNSTNQWTMTGNDAGNVNTGPTGVFYFTSMGHLVGGTGVDTFRFDSASDKVVGINGGGAPAGQGDWLKYALFPSSSTVTVNLATGSATSVNNGAAGSVTNIQNVLGSSSGTNVLTGDSQGNILIGGSGLNTIVGGSGSSLLIGGSGHGTITGGSGTDILIAGFTAYSAQSTAGVDALMSILAELQSADSFAQKVSDIIDGYATDGGSHLNGNNKLTWGGTVRASSGAFTLSGDTSASLAADWFFSNASSTVKDFNDDGVKDEHNNNAIGVF